MAQQNFWEHDKVVNPPAAGAVGGGPQLVTGTPYRANADARDTRQEQRNIQQNDREQQNQDFNQGLKLVESFKSDPTVKAYREVLPQVMNAINAAPGGQGDLTVIYAWAKAMDPTGSVRDSDTELATSASSVQQRAAQMAASVQNGNVLAPEVRQGLIEEMRNKGRQLDLQYSSVYDNYRDRARRAGIPVEELGNHEGDLYRATEEAYIRAHGGTPRYTVGPMAEQQKPDAADIHFGDETGPGGNPFNSQQQALFDAWTKANPNANADQLRSFVASLGIQGDINAEDLIKQRDKLGYIPSATDARRGLTPDEQATVDKRIAENKSATGAVGAGVAGAGDILTMGTMDELGGAADAVAGAMKGEGSFGDLYDSYSAMNRAYLGGVQDNHPVAYATGQLLGGLAIPVGYERVGYEAGVAAMREARAAGAASDAALQAGRQAAAQAVRNRLIRDGAIMGGAHGAGSGEGVGGRVAGAVGEAGMGAIGGGAFGVAGEALAPRMAARAAAARAAPLTEDARLSREVAQAADDLNVRVPKYAVSNEADRVKASAVAKSPFGAPAIKAGAENMVNDAQTARQGIVDSVGTSYSGQIRMGEAARDAGQRTVRAERNRIGVIYRQAREAAGNELVAPTQTMQTLSSLIREERAVPGGTKVGSVLERYADAFDQGGPMSIDGARKMRTELRSRLRNEADMTPDAADRLVTQIMGAVSQDIENGLRSAGRDSAIPLFRQADAEWSRWLDVEDDVLKPYLGKDLRKNGSDVARALMSDVKGRGDRLVQFLNAVPPEEANNVRATLIEQLGRATSHNQNAEGTAFSLDTFLTNWDQIRDSRNLIFPPETVDALSKLAKVAEGVRKAQKVANHSNTGIPLWSAFFSGTPGVGAGLSVMTGDAKAFAGSMVASGAVGLKHLVTSRLLASPEFARRLVNTPSNAQAAAAYWSRPWVAGLAKSNPQIASELLDFQGGILRAMNDNVARSGIVAASPDEGPKKDSQSN